MCAKEKERKRLTERTRKRQWLNRNRRETLKDVRGYVAIKTATKRNGKDVKVSKSPIICFSLLFVSPIPSFFLFLFVCLHSRYAILYMFWGFVEFWHSQKRSKKHSVADKGFKRAHTSNNRHNNKL